MTQLIDTVRKGLLFASLWSLTIPGIKGFDLALGSLSLGRLQPFKFFFMAWLASQVLWLCQPSKHPQLPKRLPRPLVGLLVGGLLLLGSLALALVLQKGGPRGWNIYVSLLLGAVAAILTALDREFPSATARQGLTVATVTLVIFSLFERFFPQHPWVVTFLSSVRDGELITMQTGSTLTPSALAEFSLRSLPLFLPFITRSPVALGTAGSLVFLNLLTLTRSGLISLIAMGAAWLTLKQNRRYLKPVLVAMPILAIILISWMGPTRVYGRYLGWMFDTSQDKTGYAFGAQRSSDERVLLARAAQESISRGPWTGIGLDGFCYRLSGHLWPLEQAAKYAPGLHTHNLYLEIWVSGGILAIVGLLGILGTVFRIAFVPFTGNGLAFYWAAIVPSFAFDARIYVSWLAITVFWFGALAWKSR